MKRGPCIGRAAIELTPKGPFDLQPLAGFGVGPETGKHHPSEPLMRLAFCLDDLSGHAGVVLRQDEDGVVHGELHGDGERSAVNYPGLRPPLFHSPYEAAAWATISARRPARQATIARRAIAEGLGRVFDLDGERLAAYPTPRKLLQIQPMKGLPEVKVERLRAVAETALAGRLDAERLRRLDPEAALAELQERPGLGPFYATLILVRSSGHADLLALGEPRGLACAAHYYGLEGPPSPERLGELAETWRPLRTWATVLLALRGRT
jgi:DNA-3-methyladenine glycosylase II